MGIAKLFEHPVSLIVLVVVILLLLGSKRLPDMARSLGRSGRILKSEVDEFKRESAEKNNSTPVAPVQQVKPVEKPEPVEGATSVGEPLDK